MNRRQFLRGVAAVSVVAHLPVWESPSVDLSYPVGDVRRYGAVGDGVTDDTAAIRDAISHGFVYFPPGFLWQTLGRF